MSKDPKGILWISLDDQRPPVNPRFPTRASHFHVTLKFNCRKGDFKELHGKCVKISVDSECYDDRVQALSVSLPEDIVPFCDNENPHITISMADGVNPVDSNRMLSSDHLFKQVNLTFSGVIEFKHFKGN